MTLKNIGDDDIRVFFDSAEGNAEGIGLNMTRQEVTDAIAFNNLPPDININEFIDELFDGLGNK